MKSGKPGEWIIRFAISHSTPAVCAEYIWVSAVEAHSYQGQGDHVQDVAVAQGPAAEGLNEGAAGAAQEVDPQNTQELNLIL